MSSISSTQSLEALFVTLIGVRNLSDLIGENVRITFFRGRIESVRIKKINYENIDSQNITIEFPDGNAIRITMAYGMQTSVSYLDRHPTTGFNLGVGVEIRGVQISYPSKNETSPMITRRR